MTRLFVYFLWAHFIIQHSRYIFTVIFLYQGVANDEADLFRARFGGYGGGGGGCNGGGGGGGFLGGKGGQNGSENGQGGISYVDTNFVIWHSLDTRHCLLEDVFS